jgi:plastocyanin
MKTTSVLLALLPLLLAAGSRAEDHHVSQKGAQFEPVELSVRAGDRVVFHNDDDVTHNVFSKTTGAEFNVKLQEPGSESPVVMERPGVVDVRCAIHPRMKLRVQVTE